jgi:hypothetical protein
MLIDAQTRFAHPDFSRFLERTARQAANTDAIVAGLARYGEMPTEDARAILTDLIPPIVAVAALPTRDHLGGYARRSRIVYIDDDIARRWRDHPQEREDPRMRRLVAATLLHEIVHWGDARTGAFRGETPAHAFNRAVFPGPIGRYW